MPRSSFSFDVGSMASPLPVDKPWYEVQCRNVLLSDKFQDGVFDKWGVSAGTWSAGSKYVYTENTGSALLAYRGDADWTNYFYECKVNLEAGSRIGIISRRVDDNNYYQFMINSGGSCFLENASGSNFASADVTISTNTDYDLKMEVSGSKIQCWVDNVLKINTFDTTFPSGNVGFKIDAGSGRWDNVEVYDTEDVLTPSSGSLLSLTAKESGRNRSSFASFDVINIDNSKAHIYSVGKEVRVYMGYSGGNMGSKFTGTIENCDPTLNNNGDVLRVECRDYYFHTAKKTDVIVYQNISGGSIITDLLNRNFPYIDTGSIIYSGTGLPRYDVIYTPIQTVIRDISENFDGGIFSINENKCAIYTSGGSVINSTDFLKAGSNILNASFSQNTDNYYDSVTVVGGDRPILDQSATVSGGSILITDSVQASGNFSPAFNSIVKLDLKTILVNSGAGISIGIQKDSSGSPDGENMVYKTVEGGNIADDDWTDFEFPVKTFLTSGNTYWWLANCSDTGSHFLHSSGGSAIFKEYYGKGVLAVNSGNPNKVFDTSREKIIVDKRIKDQDTADAKANKMVEELSVLHYNGKVRCIGQPTIRSGEMLRVQIDSEGIDDYFETRSVTHKIDGKGYVCSVNLDNEPQMAGNLLKDHEDRLRALETIEINNDVNLIKNFSIPSEEFEFNSDVLDRFDMTYLGSAFILGNAIHGVLGSGVGSAVLGTGGGSFGNWSSI